MATSNKTFFLFSSRALTTTPIRSDVFKIGKRIRNENYYKKLDNVEPSYELIYRAPFEYLIPMCRHVPSFLLISVSCGFAYQFITGSQIFDENAEFMTGPIVASSGEMMGFTVAFYISNLILIYGVTKYPLRIYKFKNRYIAMFEGFLPLSPRPYHFRKGDLFSTPSILPWYESIFKMKDRTVLVFAHHFKKPIYFTDMFRK
ncbi:hypothetical protein Bhyg_08075 [Pseudolycoriella hygida]|uniref:Uncharacterized protein n=1 Tax=Pseudolycoriella hygida TaxID=35572 RepID=A0A9Q0N5R0_9DIPT|nr:hypothetical protein Bhyg_08075 [Pseudolycoriella hygida]